MSEKQNRDVADKFLNEVSALGESYGIVGVVAGAIKEGEDKVSGFSTGFGSGDSFKNPYLLTAFVDSIESKISTVKLKASLLMIDEMDEKGGSVMSGLKKALKEIGEKVLEFKNGK